MTINLPSTLTGVRLWHRKLLGKINHWFSHRESDDPESIVFIRGRLECLDPKLFKKLDIISACMTYLDVDLPSIDRYVNVLKYFNAISLRTEKADIESIKFVRRRVTIEAFFQDNLGRYLDEPVLIQQFKQEAFLLLKQYEQLESEKLGMAGYNARVLRSLFLTISNIADILRHYSIHR